MRKRVSCSVNVHVDRSEGNVKLEVGSKIGGRFEILKALGEGGVGVVYRVKDHEQDTVVALKVLKKEIAKNRLAMERFMREVNVMRNIDHEGVVKVIETGRMGETLFYTMTCVDGQSIKSFLDLAGAFDVTQSVAIINELCDIMAAIHAVAIHRDLSSDNVMIRRDGTICLLDFGTARITDEESDLTVAGVHLGKACYSAPEQQTDSSNIDARADLYSMGILFYEMLSNKLIMGYEPISAHVEELDNTYDEFFQKALAQDADDRFSSVEEFQVSLNALMAG
jgi:eukaryotic-like serine/threonine-protein kinase